MHIIKTLDLFSFNNRKNLIQVHKPRDLIKGNTPRLSSLQLLHFTIIAINMQRPANSVLFFETERVQKIN